jgi:hypothetical protein
VPDPFEEKSRRFFPGERYFWILNTLGWIVTLSLVNPGESLLGSSDDHAKPQGIYLVALWLAYYVLGTLTVLVFRSCYYRQRWYEKKFISSLPLAIMAALGGGLALAFLVVLPVELLQGGDFRIVNEAGTVVYEGIFATTLYAGYELAFILLAWLLAYQGIEGSVNARNLAVRALALESSLKEARLNALAGQINPHFLFNALNNVRFMIRRDADRAEESLVDLSEILRHSLESSQQGKDFLTRELAIVERYLSLMKIQMQHRLSYSIQTRDTPERVLIPPMVIQILVENAIKHGLEKIREGGNISVHCSTVAGKLHIEVRNPVASDGSATRSSEEPTLSGGGVGLANIRKRLALLYGDDAQLSISQHDGAFLVHIELPCEEAS